MVYFIVPILFGIVMFALGFIAGRLSKSFKKIGSFVINEGDPQKPAFWVEMDYDLDVIERQAVIGFNVLFHHYQTPPEND